MDDILGRIDDVLDAAGEPGFGADYWQQVDSQPPSCKNCGRPIRSADTSTGWTHDGDWQGVRCGGMLTGAVPVPR